MLIIVCHRPSNSLRRGLALHAQGVMSACREGIASCMPSELIVASPGEAAGDAQGQQPGSAAPRWCAGCSPCAGAAVRRRPLSSCSHAGETLAWRAVQSSSHCRLRVSSGVLSVHRALHQALHCVERLLAGMPQALVALMGASLPLREGGCVPALQVLHMLGDALHTAAAHHTHPPALSGSSF